MNKEKILLIFQARGRVDYCFSWFRNNYQNYIILIKGKTKKDSKNTKDSILF